MKQARRRARQAMVLALGVLALLAGLVWTPTGARADEGVPSDEKVAKALKLKQRADRSMRDLRYSEALELYNRSYALNPLPALLYNRGRALEALSRFPEALDQLEEFVNTAPAELKAKTPHIDELIEEIRGKITTLTIKSKVKRARILVRSQAVGTTPLKRPLRVNAGDATIEVSAEGYKPFKKKVTLPPGGELTIDATLVPKATTGLLIVSSTVPGAVVFIDKKRVGTAPAEQRVEKGKHQIRVRAEGYEEALTTAVVRAGERKRVKIPLEKTAPITARWWFWTGAAVLVAGGVALTIALTTEKEAGKGDLTPSQVPGPLVRF